MRCKPLLSTFPTRSNARFLHGDPRMQKIRQGPRVCRKSLDFRHVPQPRITRVFQNLRNGSTMKQVCDGSTGGNNFGSARSVFSWRRNDCCDTFSSGGVLSNSSENKGLCHFTPGTTKFHVEHMTTANPNDLTLTPRSQIHRTRQGNDFPVMRS